MFSTRWSTSRSRCELMAIQKSWKICQILLSEGSCARQDQLWNKHRTEWPRLEILVLATSWILWLQRLWPPMSQAHTGNFKIGKAKKIFYSHCSWRNSMKITYSWWLLSDARLVSKNWIRSLWKHRTSKCDVRKHLVGGKTKIALKIWRERMVGL